MQSFRVADITADDFDVRMMTGYDLPACGWKLSVEDDDTLSFGNELLDQVYPYKTAASGHQSCHRLNPPASR
jgi:hypothetical protein